jgi:hypothetical protein
LKNARKYRGFSVFHKLSTAVNPIFPYCGKPLSGVVEIGPFFPISNEK